MVSVSQRRETVKWIAQNHVKEILGKIQVDVYARNMMQLVT
jgi:hypothetical protein